MAGSRRPQGVAARQNDRPGGTPSCPVRSGPHSDTRPPKRMRPRSLSKEALPQVRIGAARPGRSSKTQRFTGRLRRRSRNSYRHAYRRERRPPSPRRPRKMSQPMIYT